MINHDNFGMLSDDEKARYKFKFCERCEFYECELIEEYMQFNGDKRNSEDKPAIETTPVKIQHIKAGEDIPTSQTAYLLFPAAYDKLHGKKEEPAPSLPYNPNMHGCIMNRFIQMECGRQNVADGIGDDFKANARGEAWDYKIESDNDKWKKESPGKWEPKQPVFISAQTGQGKNYFIENALLPYVREMNIKKKTDQRVLIISNRLALKMQIKNRLANRDNDQDEEFFANYKGFPADVMTYQAILKRTEQLKKKQEIGRSRYIFVVCDEAHFFTSDAMFNYDTEKVLVAIVRTFQKAIRIYMSATPYGHL